jgi:ABC-type dipeptide/oligopeptide/nickel transport system ATPase component
MNDGLSVKNLTVEYVHGADVMAAVKKVSFELPAGKTVGLVGESGCGKSTLALAIMNLLPREESRIASGEIVFSGRRETAMIFQDPFSSLNPVMSIEEQLVEVMTRRRAVELLEEVQLSDPERILGSYPHQLSGGQRQRVMIAMALAKNPSLLIADEPTTALDVTVQSEIMALLRKLKNSHNMSMLFVTHNIGLIKGTADELAVMYGGKIVEIGPTDQILKKPAHPYTKGLLQCIPTLKKHDGPLPVLKYAP